MTAIHARFMQMLPRIEAHARIYFRDTRSAAKRADCIAETIAIAWQWFDRLDRRGKDATQFVSAIATYAAKAVKCGRRVAGMESAKDALNARTQQRHGFHVDPLPAVMPMIAAPLTDALADNMVTPPPDAAAFRVDFPRWLGSLGDRDRRLAAALMLGERTGAAAKRFRLSQARVSQVRRELSQDWARFHGEPTEAVA